MTGQGSDNAFSRLLFLENFGEGVFFTVEPSTQAKVGG